MALPEDPLGASELVEAEEVIEICSDPAKFVNGFMARDRMR